MSSLQEYETLMWEHNWKHLSWHLNIPICFIFMTIKKLFV